MDPEQEQSDLDLHYLSKGLQIVQQTKKSIRLLNTFEFSVYTLYGQDFMKCTYVCAAQTTQIDRT